ncbi:hypothetical protein B0T25DRAFT_554090 [Lasiosphaeria hispida]|uniref:Uncharacterized protein n=1 Tax=Lasiosphaeria hispida TaxID=260671 RepID=A0AAJ0MBH3_9PEZI|nr:hypothetical protein B0T25DRAFT_554090 [Lasiosphaeria hispida]
MRNILRLHFTLPRPWSVTPPKLDDRTISRRQLEDQRKVAMRFVTIFLSTLAAAAPQLGKRCRIGYGIQPCWVRWDHTECEAYIPTGVTYVFDEANKQVTIQGLCESCSRALALEHVRKRPDSWATSFGHVEDVGNGTFVITDANEQRMGFLKGLKPHPQVWGTSCVYVEGDPEPEYE